MSLSQYVAPKKSILVAGMAQPLDIEGLSLSSLAILVRTHLADLDAVFDLFIAGAEIPPDKIPDFLGSLIMQAPGLVANIIAVAAGEPEAAPQAEKLPFAIQLDALVTIGELTFTEPGSVKKLLEQIAMLLTKTGMKETLTKAKAKTPTKRR